MQAWHVKGDPSEPFPTERDNVLFVNVEIPEVLDYVPVTGGEFTGAISGPTLDLVTPGTVILKGDNGRPTGAGSTIGHLNVWHTKVADATTTPKNELKVYVGTNNDDLIDRGPVTVWLVQGDKMQVWTCGSSGWFTDSQRVWHVSAIGVDGDDLDNDVDTEIIMTSGEPSAYATLEGVERMVETYAVSRVEGGTFELPISGPALEPLGAKEMTLNVIGSSGWNDNPPPEGELHAVTSWYDAGGQRFKIDLGQSASQWANRDEVYYMLVQAHGTQIVYCESSAQQSVIAGTTLKVESADVSGDDLIDGRAVWLYTSSRTRRRMRRS